MHEGGFIAYGSSLVRVYREFSWPFSWPSCCVVRQPAELPVLQPTTFDLVINMKIVKALGELLCRFLDAGECYRSHALDRPASKKRQGTKSRSVMRRRCGARYGDLTAA